MRNKASNNLSPGSFVFIVGLRKADVPFDRGFSGKILGVSDARDGKARAGRWRRLRPDLAAATIALR